MDKREKAISLREATRELVRSLSLLDKDRASCCGVTIAQCHAIVEIGRMGRTSPSLLAEHLRLDRSTVTRLADSLLEMGFVVREQDPADRRSIFIELTEKGQRFFLSTEKTMLTFYASIIEKIPSGGLDPLLAGLRVIAESFSAGECNCFPQDAFTREDKEGD